METSLTPDSDPVAVEAWIMIWQYSKTDSSILFGSGGIVSASASHSTSAPPHTADRVLLQLRCTEVHDAKACDDETHAFTKFNEPARGIFGWGSLLLNAGIAVVLSPGQLCCRRGHKNTQSKTATSSLAALSSRLWAAPVYMIL